MDLSRLRRTQELESFVIYPKESQSEYPSSVILRDFLIIKDFQKQRYQVVEPFEIKFYSKRSLRERYAVTFKGGSERLQ